MTDKKLINNYSSNKINRKLPLYIGLFNFTKLNLVLNMHEILQSIYLIKKFIFITTRFKCINF